MPAYNAARTISESVKSVLEQTIDDLELVVVDDGSTDDTGSIVRSFDDPRIRYVRTENSGVSAARNCGFAMSHGRYLQFLDSDDLLHPAKIERQIERMSADHDLSSAVCAWGRFSQHVDDLLVVRGPHWRDCDPLEHLRFELCGKGTMPPLVWLVPRPIAEQVGEWRVGVNRMEDTDYFARVAMASRHILFCGDTWGYYRSWQPGSLSAAAGRRTAESMRASCRAIEQEMLKHFLLSDVQSILADMYRFAAIACYQHTLDIGRELEADVRRLGGSDIHPGVGRWPRRLVTSLFGWPFAMRVTGLARWVRTAMRT